MGLLGTFKGNVGSLCRRGGEKTTFVSALASSQKKFIDREKAAPSPLKDSQGVKKKERPPGKGRPDSGSMQPAVKDKESVGIFWVGAEGGQQDRGGGVLGGHGK